MKSDIFIFFFSFFCIFLPPVMLDNNMIGKGDAVLIVLFGIGIGAGRIFYNTNKTTKKYE
jgi:hypothetical protein